MAQIDKHTIKNLSLLSRINCSEEEQESLLKDLRNILDYVVQLQSVDTEGVEACNHVLANMHNVMREDIVGETLSHTELMKNAPSHSGGLIKVPPVIKQF